MTEILTMGEMLVEIMREQEDVPLDQAGTFRGPYPSVWERMILENAFWSD